MDGEWFEDQELWDAFRDHMFPEDRVSRAEEQVESLVSLLEIEEGSFLDIPCGIGRHSIELADRGFEVRGVDISRSYVKEARERSSEAEFDQGDMKDYDAGRRFDVVLNLWNSFGYYEDEKDNLEVLKNFHSHLRDGGELVLEISTKETISSDFFGSRYWEEQDGRYLLHRRKASDNWRWNKMKWIVVGENNLEEYTVKHRLYSAEKIDEMLDQAGFGPREFYGGLDGSEFDGDADRLVVVAEK